MTNSLPTLAILITLSGCVSILPQSPPMKEATFRGSMQQVWLATEKALANYPIAESNIDSGILKTDYLRGDNCWTSPGQTQRYTSGIRCSLSFQFVKLPGSGIRVRITKTLEMVRDFVSEPEGIATDGLEEMTLLYRIDRELTVAKELSRQSKESE